MTSVLQKIGGWSVRRKLTFILAVTLIPLIGLMILYLSVVRHLVAVQEEVNHILAVQVQTRALLGLMVDTQDGFRGFVLTRNEKFLAPFYDAEEAFDPAIHRLETMVQTSKEQLTLVDRIEDRVRELLQTKERLIDAVRFGDLAPVRAHIESGAGSEALAAIRADLTAFEDLQKQTLTRKHRQADRWAVLTQYWLGAGILGILLLWGLSARLLARTITGPLATLTSHALNFGHGKMNGRIPVASTDELGRLARTMEQMAERIEHHIKQREAFDAIGKEISTIGPDGLEGVLRRITERAGHELDLDLALVLLWNEKIGCWNVGAASDNWHDILRRSLLIREETPIAITALTTGKAQIVDDLGARPEPVLQIRDRMGAKSLLAVPLRDQRGAFGVLALASTVRKRTFSDWEVRLAQQFADQAAIAIMNARLYEAAQQRGEGLQSRLEELEGYAANMAHDLKGPARRMAELASLLQADYHGRLDERADRYLNWIRTNGQQLMERIDEVLRLARIGIVREVVEPVDPREVIDTVLKGCAEEIERQGATVHIGESFPHLACNRIHLFQILDNLIRNALKFSSNERPPVLEVGVQPTTSMPVMFVRDNGLGISPSDRDRIFEPFERLDQNVAPGTGIGLTIVKKIIELYEGKVWVESEPGKGSTFYFTLPLYGELLTPGAVKGKAEA